MYGSAACPSYTPSRWFESTLPYQSPGGISRPDRTMLVAGSAFRVTLEAGADDPVIGRPLDDDVPGADRHLFAGLRQMPELGRQVAAQRRCLSVAKVSAEQLAQGVDGRGAGDDRSIGEVAFGDFVEHVT